MRLYPILLAFSIAFGSVSSSAAEAEKTPPAVEKAVSALLKELIGDGELPAFEVRATPLDKLYEITLEGMILYVSADGRYLIQGGDILDLSEGRKNLTEARRGEIRLQAMGEMKPEEMIAFKPKGETKHVLTAFTDTDCFYCQKLHKEVPKLNEAGIEVRYMAFPRAGVGSPTYHTMVSVWCAEDQQKALTDAKAGHSVEQRNCDNPVQKQYELGRRMGVSGTPALLLPNGELYPGYAPADKLIKLLAEGGK